MRAIIASIILLTAAMAMPTTNAATLPTSLSQIDCLQPTIEGAPSDLCVIYIGACVPHQGEYLCYRVAGNNGYWICIVYWSSDTDDNGWSWEDPDDRVIHEECIDTLTG